MNKSESEPSESFQSLGLSDTTLASLAKAGYETPSPVQAGVIPWALDGFDVLGQAQTGTGKTASFVLPILEIIDEFPDAKLPLALILVPTRELAVQVQGETTKLASGRDVRSVAAYGGTPIRRQIQDLGRNPQIVVGTPGRVIDHISRKTLNLSELEVVVLDEADRMLDIGFRPDIEKILRRCPEERQTLLLSATVPPSIERLANRYMYEPKMLNFSTQDIAVETIEQHYFTVEAQMKFELLMRLIEREDPTQAIVFCRTKRGTERVYQRLRKKIKNVGCMHGDMNQSVRNRMMASFRANELRILVATDVIGRGIDVTGISHIINFDIPEDCDDYVHRVGRTGRMGREGTAFTFVTVDEGPQLTRIEKRIDKLLLQDSIEGFDPTPAPVEVKDDNEPKPPAPLYGPGGRSKRRHRRAL